MPRQGAPALDGAAPLVMMATGGSARRHLVAKQYVLTITGRGWRKISLHASERAAHAAMTAWIYAHWQQYAPGSAPADASDAAITAAFLRANTAHITTDIVQAG
jgi:hypothetical protein